MARGAVLAVGLLASFATGFVVRPLVTKSSSGTAPPAPKVAQSPTAATLSRHLGTFLRIEGIRQEKGKVGAGTLLVDHVDRGELSPPVSIEVENLDLPEGERCAISGYESGRWIGVPPLPESEGVPQSQAMWQFYRYFIATSVQAPPALAEQFRRSRGAR